MRAGYRRAFAAGVAVAWSLAAAMVASGRQPCSDEPGFGALICRVTELRDAAGDLDRYLAIRLARIDRHLTQAALACTGGRTSTARRQLRAVRNRLPHARRTLDRAVGRGRVDGRVASELDGVFRIASALTRATRARLERQPCPELVEILRPLDGDVRPDGSVLFLARLAPTADPATLGVQLQGPTGSHVITPDVLSASQAWARFRCPSSGQYVLRVAVRDRAAALTDGEEVSVRCGPVGGLTLGAIAETLVDNDDAPNVLRLIPVRPLRGGASYAVVATRGLRTTQSGYIEASAAFRAAAGIPGRPRRGPAAIFLGDDADWRNPFPSQRHLRADGTIQIPDGFTARALPADARLDGVRSFLRSLDALSEEHVGFSSHTTPVLRFEKAVNLNTATPDRVFMVEVVNPTGARTDLAAVLEVLERERGVPREEIVVASVFPVEDVAGAMTTVREQIAARATTAPPTADYADSDPGDQRAFGIFSPEDPEFASFFGGSAPASVGMVARGQFPSPEYRTRDVSGRLRIPAAFLDGSQVPPMEMIEFLLAIPSGEPPPEGFPTVIAQHGFGGNTGFVIDMAGALTAAGLAVIGIPAPEHGPRGMFLDFFVFEDFNAFAENWRQASIDLFQLAQLVLAGLDLDGDGVSEIRPVDLGYIGVSMGGVTGAVFTAIEPLVTAAVLNVPGGRLAQFAGGISSLATPFLERFAADAGISSRTCEGRPAAAVCTSDADCVHGEACVFNDDFVGLLEAALPNFQTQLDRADGSAFGHLFRLDPPGGRPKAVLIQEGVGDVIVANPLTEALARAMGLSANAVDSAPGGVAGLWRFPPPAGHGILALSEVRAQAAHFLASGGTEITAP